MLLLLFLNNSNRICSSCHLLVCGRLSFVFCATYMIESVFDRCFTRMHYLLYPSSHPLPGDIPEAICPAVSNPLIGMQICILWVIPWQWWFLFSYFYSLVVPFWDNMRMSIILERWMFHLCPSPDGSSVPQSSGVFHSISPLVLQTPPQMVSRPAQCCPGDFPWFTTGGFLPGLQCVLSPLARWPRLIFRFRE